MLASLCSRTTVLAMADEDLAALGAGVTPAAPAGGIEPPATLPATGADARTANQVRVGVALGALVMIGLGAALRRRRRRLAAVRLRCR